MSEIRHFHFVPIGGTAMVPLAALLREEGHLVTGMPSLASSVDMGG
jgi:UDP-N-acetylmuramate-alanine ligase